MSIESLTELKRSLDECSTRKEFIKLAKDIRLDHTHFADQMTWDRTHYTRNCIFRTDTYELLLLCWEPGQDTPIHCHNGEECWVYMVQGKIHESRYEFPKDHKPEIKYGKDFSAGQVSYINDDMGVHQLYNASGERSVSLHLYVGPIDQCRVFDENTGSFVWKPLTYDTVSETA